MNDTGKHESGETPIDAHAHSKGDDNAPSAERNTPLKEGERDSGPSLMDVALALVKRWEPLVALVALLLAVLTEWHVLHATRELRILQNGISDAQIDLQAKFDAQGSRLSALGQEIEGHARKLVILEESISKQTESVNNKLEAESKRLGSIADNLGDIEGRIGDIIPIKIPVYISATFQAAPVEQDLSWWALGLERGARAFERAGQPIFTHSGRLYQIDLCRWDDQGNVAARATDLVGDFSRRYPNSPVGFVIGPISSTQAKELKDSSAYRDSKLIELLPIPTSRSSLDPGHRRFRMSPGNDSQARAAFALLGKGKKVLVYDDREDENHEYVRDFVEEVKRVSPGSQPEMMSMARFESVIRTARPSGYAGIVYAGMSANARQIISAIQANGDWRDVPLILCDGCARGLIQFAGGGAIDLPNLYLLFQSRNSMPIDSFERGAPPRVSAAPLGFDAMKIVRVSLENAAEVSADAVCSALRELLIEGTALDYTFDETGANAAANWYVYQIKPGLVFELYQSDQPIPFEPR